ncbi:extracellular matrix regulator RemB, partial [Bacillus sp. WP8]|uniref:extracellular matrix regulator RemB n=1 Tax=Bacillus sp. WP8 TaxID=756828 RepID=UPI0011A238FD
HHFLLSTPHILPILHYKITSSSLLQQFLQKQHKHIISLSQPTPKSILLTTQSLYYSPLSSTTLKKHPSFLIQ